MHRLQLAMASLKPPDFPIATANQEDFKGLTLFFRVHEKLSELWLGIDKCLLSQVATQGAGERLFKTFLKPKVKKLDELSRRT